MRVKALALNLLLSLCSVVLLIGGLELAARRVNPFTPFLLIPRDFNCMQRSTTYSLEFRPNCRGTLSETVHETNSLGMRGPELRDDGSRRILALGDSCTWGWHVAQDETYPAVLEEILDARPSKTRYQALNAGVPGYTSHQGLVYLREKGLALNPAIVIAGFGWNDATPAGDLEQQIAVERRLMPLIRFDDWLLIQSKFYRWWRYRSAGAAKAKHPLRVPLRRYAANLESMVDLASKHGARVVLLNFWQRTARPLWHDALARIAEQRNVPMVAYDGPRVDLVHPTVEGQRILAERIAAEMERRGFLSN